MDGWLVGECRAFRSLRRESWEDVRWDGMGVAACAERRCWIGCMVSVVGYKVGVLVSGWLQSVAPMLLRVVMEDGKT